MDLDVLRRRYLDELENSVIPFWVKYGYDRENGGFLTCLERGGEVYDDRKYIWMQGRAVWSFSKFYNELERKPEWLEIARAGVEFLERHAFDASGRCWFSTSRDGLTPTGYQRKPYAAVFVFLGYWEYFKASGDFRYHTMALELFERIRGWIADPGLLGRPLPVARNLADVMVVLSMAIEIASVSSDPKYIQIIRESIAAAEAFLEPKRGVLLENLPDPATPEGRLFCPGSSVEVAWFLIHGEIVLENYHAMVEHGKDRLPQHYARIRRWLDVMERSLTLGWDEEFGGLYYFMDLEGKPTLQLESNMKLWWPHTEAMYGCVLALMETKEYAARMRKKAGKAVSEGERSYAERAEELELEIRKWSAWLEKVDSYAFAHFADREYGEWFGYCDRQGKPSHTLKGNNYKGCFHVPRALLFAAHRIAR